MKTIPKLRARRMWANKCYMTEPGADVLTVTNPSVRYDVRVAVIPLNDPEALVHCAYEASRLPGEDGLTQMRAALIAIGVLPRAKKGRK